MFELGENVLVFLVSGYNPIAYVGRVSRIIGPEGAELENTHHITWCDGAEWAKLAGGDIELRRQTQRYYRRAGIVRFAGCRDARHWFGELPKIS